MKSTLLVAGLIGLSCQALAQLSTIVPGANATTRGDVDSMNAFSNGERRYQVVIASSQLVQHLGRNLDGISFRQRVVTPTAPNNNVSLPSYTIRIGRGVSPSNITTTFANNYRGSSLLVRSGVLNVAPNTFPWAGSPSTFGFVIPFQTPYRYTGGDLTIEIAHRVVVGGLGNLSLESVSPNSGILGGYGANASAILATSETATTGVAAPFAIMQLRSAPGSPSLSGTITLNDSDGNFSNENVTIRVVNPATNVVVGNYGALLSANGSFSLETTLNAGTYDIYIKGDTFLQKKLAGRALIVGANTLNTVLINGDVNGDNEVGAADFSTIAASYDLVLGDPSFSSLADLNDDGEVGAADFSILAANYDEVGDSL